MPPWWDKPRRRGPTVAYGGGGTPYPAYGTGVGLPPNMGEGGVMQDLVRITSQRCELCHRAEAGAGSE